MIFRKVHRSYESTTATTPVQREEGRCCASSDGATPDSSYLSIRYTHITFIYIVMLSMLIHLLHLDKKKLFSEILFQYYKRSRVT